MTGGGYPENPEPLRQEEGVSGQGDSVGDKQGGAGRAGPVREGRFCFKSSS